MDSSAQSSASWRKPSSPMIKLHSWHPKTSQSCRKWVPKPYGEPTTENQNMTTRTFKRSSFWFLKMRFLKGGQKDTPLNNHMWQINKTDLSCNGRTISKYLKSTNVKRVPIPNRRENLSSWATTTKGVETLTHDANLITRDGLDDLVGWSWHFLEWHYQSENAQSCLKWTTWYQNRH